MYWVTGFVDARVTYIDLKNGNGSVYNGPAAAGEDTVIFTISDEDFMSMARKVCSCVM